MGAHITPSMTDALSTRDLARLKALFARAYADGHTAGRSCARITRRPKAERKRQTEAA